MDTSQGFVVPNPESLDPIPTPSPTPIKKNRFWMPAIILLLVAIALSTGVSFFLLSYQNSRAKAPAQTNLTAETENPFAANEETNPFGTSESDAVNPFSEEAVTKNPFDVFSEDTAQAGTSGEYENPF